MHIRAYEILEVALFSYVRTVLSCMMGHVALPSILRKISTDHAHDELREFRETIQGMFETYSYEQSILRTANNLMATDKYESMRALQRKKAHAFTPRSQVCSSCLRDWNEENHNKANTSASNASSAAFGLKLILFDCSHVFHDTCLGRLGTKCPICTSDRKNKANNSLASKKAAVAINTSNANKDKEDSSNSSSSSSSSSLSSSNVRALQELKTQEIVHRLHLAQRRTDRGTYTRFHDRLRSFAVESDSSSSFGSSPADEADSWNNSNVATASKKDHETNIALNFKLPSLIAPLALQKEPNRLNGPGGMLKPQVEKVLTPLDLQMAE